MELVVLILTGGLAGWIAATLVRGAGSGVVINILLGVVGGLLGGKLLALLGVGPAGWLVELATAVAAAAVLLSGFDLTRRRWRSGRGATTRGARPLRRVRRGNQR